MTTPERWQRVKKLFHAAIERAPEERDAYLEETCAGDEELRREVKSLIASHERPGSFIDSPAYEAAAMLFDGRSTSLVGQSLGHYRILSLLGTGGMGEVYLAEDTKLKRRVAVKFLPAHLSSDKTACAVLSRRRVPHWRFHTRVSVQSMRLVRLEKAAITS